MDWQFAAWLLLGGSTLLLLGLPVAFTFLAVNVVGAALWMNGEVGLVQLSRNAVSSVASFALTPIPLFVLMGELLSRSGIARKLFDAFAVLVGRMPGGLIQVNIFASSLFAALCGSSTATVATIGQLSLPQLRARQYPEGLVLGSIAGAGTLGILIPPSVALILYGFAFNVSIGDLFLAGILPGLMAPQIESAVRPILTLLGGA